MLARLVLLLCCCLPLIATTKHSIGAEANVSYGRHQFDDWEREHWSFMPVERPEVPPVSRQEWVRTPVDAFILAELEAKGIEPAGEADRATLLRRVYLDLIGLPPTLDEQQAFLEDESPDAYERVVDDLLSRPQYGERWGRHWLDVVRYAESNGYERDNPKPHAWRYRDYVIDAFNRDKPFDRFLIEQIAGDEIDGTNAETQIATTFLRLGLWDDEPADPKVDRYDQLDDVLDVTATAFMGLTIRCARCHDHKYEPISQRDYTRMLAIFEPLKRPQNGRTDLDRLVGTPEELASYRQAMAEADRRVAELQAQIDELNASVRRRVYEADPDAWPRELIDAIETAPDKRSDEQKKLSAASKADLMKSVEAVLLDDERKRLAAWEADLKATNDARPPEPPRAYVWYEDTTEAPTTHLFDRGDPYHPVEPVAVGLPAVLVDAPPPPPEPRATSTGRRLQLAKWLADPAHPLTARVFVNRVWQHHFGRGIVETVNDFGIMGEPPTHPELLDWLAAEFVAEGWRVKPLHRLIVTSQAYRLAASAPNETVDRDSDGSLFSHWSPRRLEAEVIRDASLAVSGELNLKAGGPSVYPEISPAVLASQSRPGLGWHKSPPEEANRRSVYVFVKRTLLLPELELMDFPSTNESCGVRNVSTVAPQALTFLNGQFTNDRARKLAERLVAEAGDDAVAQVDHAFRLALCRLPKDEERSAVLDFLDRQSQQIASDGQASDESPIDARRAALVSFCLVLLNSNEFVYLP